MPASVSAVASQPSYPAGLSPDAIAFAASLAQARAPVEQEDLPPLDMAPAPVLPGIPEDQVRGSRLPSPDDMAPMPNPLPDIDDQGRLRSIDPPDRDPMPQMEDEARAPVDPMAVAPTLPDEIAAISDEPTDQAEVAQETTDEAETSAAQADSASPADAADAATADDSSDGTGGSEAAGGAGGAEGGGEGGDGDGGG